MQRLSWLKPFVLLWIVLFSALHCASAGEWKITYAESGNFNNETISIRHQDEEINHYSGGNNSGNGLYSMPLFEDYSLSPGENGITNVTRQAGDEPARTYSAYPGEFNSMRLDWDSYGSGYNTNDHYHKGATAGYANGNLSVHPVFHWVRQQIYDYESGRVYLNPNDNPPKTIFYAERATVWGGEYISHNDGYSLLDEYDAGHPFKGSEFTFSGVSNPLSGTDGGGDFDFKGYHSDRRDQYQGASYGSDRFQVSKLDTGGKDDVDGPTRAFSGTISLNTSYGSLDDPFQRNGSASIGFGYSVTSVNFGLNVNGSGAPANSDPLNRDIDAFVSRGYKGDDVADHAATAFWQGRASFDASATKGDYPASAIWDNQTYKWTVGPSVYLPEFPVPTDAEKSRQSPEASVTHKDFAWDFGDAASAGGFPRTSTVSVEVKNPIGNAPPLGPAKVTIHWHTPRQFRVTMSVYGEGGSAPDPLQLNEVEDIDLQIERYKQARRDVIDTGGKGVVVGAAVVVLLPVLPAVIPAAELGEVAEAALIEQQVADSMAYNAARNALVRQLLVSSAALGAVSYDLLGNRVFEQKVEMKDIDSNTWVEVKDDKEHLRGNTPGDNPNPNPTPGGGPGSTPGDNPNANPTPGGGPGTTPGDTPNPNPTPGGGPGSTPGDNPHANPTPGVPNPTPGIPNPNPTGQPNPTPVSPNPTPGVPNPTPTSPQPLPQPTPGNPPVPTPIDPPLPTPGDHPSLNPTPGATPTTPPGDTPTGVPIPHDPPFVGPRMGDMDKGDWKPLDPTGYPDIDRAVVEVDNLNHIGDEDIDNCGACTGAALARELGLDAGSVASNFNTYRGGMSEEELTQEMKMEGATLTDLKEFTTEADMLAYLAHLSPGQAGAIAEYYHTEEGEGKAHWYNGTVRDGKAVTYDTQSGKGSRPATQGSTFSVFVYEREDMRGNK